MPPAKFVIENAGLVYDAHNRPNSESFCSFVSTCVLSSGTFSPPSTPATLIN